MAALVTPVSPSARGVASKQPQILKVMPLVPYIYSASIFSLHCKDHLSIQSSARPQ